MPTNKERIAALERKIEDLKSRGDDDHPLTPAEIRELEPEEVEALWAERRERRAEKYEFDPRGKGLLAYARNHRVMDKTDDQTPRGKRRAIREAGDGDGE
ncbi:MAG: hypothetical protein M3355_08580 [Actinomycetota bacterium]|nr:hypothetical protein [Actinomycetota bacterium]